MYLKKVLVPHCISQSYGIYDHHQTEWGLFHHTFWDTLTVLLFASSIFLSGQNNLWVSYEAVGYLVADQGTSVGDFYHVSYEECEAHCTSTSNCRSFTFCGFGYGRCHLKNRVLSGNEQDEFSINCNSYRMITNDSTAPYRSHYSEISFRPKLFLTNHSFITFINF